MTQFFVVVIILVGALYWLTRYLLDKQKQQALEDLYKEYHELLQKFNALPSQLREHLAEMYRVIRLSQNEIEGRYKNYKQSQDVLQYAAAKKVQGKELFRQLQENRQKWEAFEKFINDVGYIKLNLENVQKEIRRKTQDLLISFGERDAEQGEKDREMQEKTEEVIRNLDFIYREYDKMQGYGYKSFDHHRIQDMEDLREKTLQESDTYMVLLNFYNKEIKIFLRSLSRRSVFYLKLKELLEGYQSGRNKMANLGEVSVSYKTFEKMEEGAKYKQDIYVSGKRASQEINVTYGVLINKMEHQFEDTLSYDEMLDLLSICKLRPMDEEADENKIAYNFHMDNLECVVAEKNKEQLLLRFAREEDFLKRIPIKW